MKYLVTGQFVEPGPLLPPEQLGPLFAGVILPSLEMMATWEEEGRISGGIYAGQREGVLLVEADSNEDVGELLASLPFWGLVKWDVIPLQSYRSAHDRDRGAMERAMAASEQ